MEKLTIKAYAKRHKISIFNVMKMVRDGSVESETVLEGNKEVVYILEDKAQEKSIQSKITKYTQTPLSLEKEIEELKQEVAELRQEMEALKKLHQ
ncbi:MAG: hypothetical protein ABXS91_01680 [Sulfurimonas sp.]